LTIEKSCGGKDKACGVGADDVPLTDVGWGIGACPNVAGASCTNAIADCDGVATCVACIDEFAVDHAITLADGALVATNPKDKAEKPINKCQATIGKAA